LDSAVDSSDVGHRLKYKQTRNIHRGTGATGNP
jgi:hypothetical protein